MARRPRARVDTSRLRAMGETSAVVARPVDTYVRPAAPQKNQQYAQILSALSTVNPAINTYISDTLTKDREKQANLGEKSFYEASPEERKAMSAKIKSGEINELQSPFWVEGFARELLRNHAKTFGSALTLEWDRKKNSGGFDFNAFVAEERGKYVEANNLSSFRSDLFNDEFAAVTQTFENQVQQRNFEHRLAEAKKARMQVAGDSMVTALEALQLKMDTTPFDDQAGDSHSDNINAVIQTAIDQGNDSKQLINMAVGFLKGTIKDLSKKGDEDGAKVASNMLRNLKLKNGTYGLVYKDGYEDIESTSERLLLKAETDAEQADDDELERQQLSEYKQVYDGVVEALNSTDPTALNTYWNSDRVEELRLSIGYLDGITEGENLLPTLNNLFQTKGIVSAPVSDAEFVDVMNNQILGQNLNDAQVRTIAEDSGFSYPQIREAVNANNGQAAQFLKNIKLPDIEKALAAEVNTKGLFEFGDSARTSFAAVDAVAELKDFIKAQMVSMGDTPEDALAARAAVSAKAKELAEVYGDRARLENDNFNQTNNPNMKPASQETVELWKSGQYTPWKNENGSMVASINGDSAEAFAAANDEGRPFDSTEIGKLIGPLILAGVSPDVILSQISTAYEAANATEKEEAQAVLAPVLQKAQTRADEAVNQSKTIVENIRPYVEPVIETVVESVSDLISGETEETAQVGVDDKGRGTFIPSLEESQKFAGTNVPSEPPLSDTERLQREARSMTPMDMSNQDPDFANTVSKADQKRRFEDAAAAASNSRRLLAEQEAARELKRENQRRQASGAEVPPSIRRNLRTQEDLDAIIVDEQQKALQKLRLNEAKQLAKLEEAADKAAVAANARRLTAKKKKEALAEIARQRKQRQQEFLKKQQLARSKSVADFIATRAKKYPEKFGVTMSDDLNSYLAKTRPLWLPFWDGLLADGQEIPAVFYEVLKENMRKGISNGN